MRGSSVSVLHIVCADVLRIVCADILQFCGPMQRERSGPLLGDLKWNFLLWGA